MKHIKRVSVAPADAFSNFLNAVGRAWNDFIFQIGADLK